jgi:hypothetical protein
MQSISSHAISSWSTSWPCHSTGDWSPTSHCGGPGLSPGQVFSEYFGFPYQLSFHRLLHIHHHLSSGSGTIGQLVADVLSGLSLTPPKKLWQTSLLSSRLRLRLMSGPSLQVYRGKSAQVRCIASIYHSLSFGRDAGIISLVHLYILQLLLPISFKDTYSSCC